MDYLGAYALAPNDTQWQGIYQGDNCSLLKHIPDNSVDMAITSPPYDGLRTYNSKWVFDFEMLSKELYRTLKPGGVLVWVVGDSVENGGETLTSMRQAIHFVDVCGFRMHDTMIYQKDGAPFPESNRYLQEFEYMLVLSKGAPRVHNLLTDKTLYGASATNSSRLKGGSTEKFQYELKKPTRTLPNVWYVTSGYMKTTKDKEAFAHPAMFPEKLAERHILTWSNPGDIVIDPFMGSGTTAKMCKIHGRKWWGCDVSQVYCDLARQRLLTTQPPLFIPETMVIQPEQLPLMAA
jgi:DNA modification methylase